MGVGVEGFGCASLGFRVEGVSDFTRNVLLVVLLATFQLKHPDYEISGATNKFTSGEKVTLLKRSVDFLRSGALLLVHKC